MWQVGDMGTALIEVITLALALAVNPLPVIAAILLVLSDHGRRNGLVFLGSWLGVLTVMSGVLVLLATASPVYDEGAESALGALMRLGFGIALLVLAGWKWRKAARDPDRSPPTWMTSLQTAKTRRAAALGAALAGGNPKNILLTLAAAGAVAEFGLPIAAELLVMFGFVLLASMAVAAPVVVSIALGERAAPVLGRWQSFLDAHSVTLMVGILVIIGVLLTAQGLTTLI